jgi:hypothetical protein
VHQCHGPLAKVALVDFFVVQQVHILVAGVGADATVERAHPAAFSFYHLEEKTLALAQNTCDALGLVVSLRLRQDAGGHGGCLWANGAAYIQQPYVDAVTGHPHEVILVA